MLVQAYTSLAKIFESKPLFLFDKQELHLIAKRAGLESIWLGQGNVGLKARNRIANDVIFVVSDGELSKRPTLSGLLKNKNVLQIPTYAFDGGEACTLYTLEGCATLDVRDCVRRNNEILREFQSDRTHFSLEGECSSVTFSLSNDIRLMQIATEQTLTGGQDFAFSTYTEVALVPNTIRTSYITAETLGYDVNGSFLCDGRSFGE